MVIILVLPSTSQAETTRSVDVGDLESQGSMTFTFSLFQYATISISNISHNGSTVLSITDPDDDYGLLLSKNDGGYVHFGDIDANMSANQIILNLETNATYKLRLLVNDGMRITFTYLNASSYQLPQSVNLYGYAFPAGQGSDYIDLGIVNGTAHRATLSSSSSLGYAIYYSTTLITSSNFTGSKSFYLANQTTKLKLEAPSSQLFHLKLNVASPYPSSGGDGSYYDDDAIIVPVADQAIYDQIVNQWNEGAPTRETIKVVTGEITSYEIGASNITLEREDLDLVFYEDELYVEYEQSRQLIGGSFRANFTNSYSDYLAFNSTFTMLVATKLVDRDGDGYPLVKLTYQNVTVEKNGSTNVTTYRDPYITTDRKAEEQPVGDDTDPLVPLNLMDIDNDDLGNHGEAFVYGTDPALADTDDDGLGDGFERDYWDYDALSSGLDWLDIYHYNLSQQARWNMFTPTGDIDGDALPNIIDSDADGDGLQDGWEHNGIEIGLLGGTPGLVYTLPHSPDSDLDGLTDGSEIFGFHTVETVPAMYAHDGLFWNSLNSTLDGVEVRYGAVMANESHYLKVNFSLEVDGTYRIKVAAREYTDDYQNTSQSALENATEIALYYNSEVVEPTDNRGFVYNTSDQNVSNNFTLTDLNMLGNHLALYELESGDYTVKVNLSASAPDRQIVIVDDVLIQYMGLDPNDPDCDDDGLGDGNMTEVDGIRYYMGEMTFASSPLNPDSDGDGAGDGDEVNLSTPQDYLLYTNPGNLDTDGDGLIDGYSRTIDRTVETPLWYRLMAISAPFSTPDNVIYTFYGEQYYGTNATLPDTDGDGLLDGNSLLVIQHSPQYWDLYDAAIAHGSFNETLSIRQITLGYTTYWAPPLEWWSPPTDEPIYEVEEFFGELSAGSNASLSDTDNDTLPDGWEYYFGFNASDGTGDNGGGGNPDSDGATNYQEYSYGLVGSFTGLYLSGVDPKLNDTDGDELEDGEEIDNTTGYGTSPLEFDTDGDWLPDGWEAEYGLDPLDNGTKTFTRQADGTYNVSGNGSLLNGSEGDLDHDGWTNGREYYLNHPFNISEVWKGGTYPDDPDYDNDGLVDGFAVTIVNDTADNWTAISALLAESPSLHYTTAEYNNTTNYTFWGEGYYGSNVKVVDTDGDGKSDGQEAQGYELFLWVNTAGTWQNVSKNISTDPKHSDWDRDFLDDGIEGANSTITIDGQPEVTAFSDPTVVDTDGDGLWDVYEKHSSDQANWTNPRNRDTDGDGLPDSVEPFWRYDLDGDGLINAVDTDSNDDTESDGDEVTVIFRTSDKSYTNDSEIAVFITGSVLSKYSFNRTVSNMSTSGLSIAEYNGSAIFSPEGYGVFTDGTDIYINITSFNGSVEYLPNGSATISDSMALDTDYSMAFKESYDFTDYIGYDSDKDGLYGSVEESGFEINMPNGSFTVITDKTKADTDGDGLLDGRNVRVHKSKINQSPYSGWLGKIHYDFDGEYYLFFGEATFQTFPDSDGFDTDCDGLLDGWNVTVDSEDDPEDLIEKFSPTILFEQSGNVYKFLGEQYFNASPLSNDTDNDTIPDADEVNGTTNIDGQNYTFNSTSPARNDTDFDNLLDLDELVNIGSDPASPDTDNDGAPDNVELDGWDVRVSKVGSTEFITYHVTSNPFLNDTDSDGLLDGPEYLNGTDPKKNDTDGDWLFDLYEATTYNGTISTTDYNPFAQEVESPEVTKCALQGYKKGKWVTKSYGGVPYTIWEGDLWVWVSAAVTDNSGLKSITIKINSPVEGSQTYFFPEYQTSAVGFVSFDLSFRQSIVGSNWEWDVDICATDHLGNSGEGANIYREGWLKTVAEATGLSWLYDRAKEAKEALENLLNWLHDFALGKFREMINPTIMSGTASMAHGNYLIPNDDITIHAITTLITKIKDMDILGILTDIVLMITLLLFISLLLIRCIQWLIDGLQLLIAYTFVLPFLCLNIITITEVGNTYADEEKHVTAQQTGQDPDEMLYQNQLIFEGLVLAVGSVLTGFAGFFWASNDPGHKAFSVHMVVIGYFLTSFVMWCFGATKLNELLYNKIKELFE